MLFLSLSREEKLRTQLFVFFGVLIGLAVIVSIAYVIVSAVKNKQNSAQPVRKSFATIISVPPTTGIRSMSYVAVMFELESGARIRFVVKSSHDFAVGDTGKLTWQGDRILSFIRMQYPSGDQKVQQKPVQQRPGANTPAEPKVMKNDFQPSKKEDNRVFCPKCGTQQHYNVGVCVRCNTTLVKPENNKSQADA